MKKIVATAALSVGLIFGMGNAQARDFAEIYTDCGLGGLIAPNHGVVAVITNITWDLGTTAVSSQLSSPDTCKGGQARTAAFIYESYPQLENDLAQGQGEHFATLLSVAGCPADVHASVGSELRGQFAESVAQPSYSSKTRYELADQLHGQLHQVTGQDCSSI
ncbi:Protein of unknown function [Marinospirillum celere]|uniref:DUF3015 domain-containing protein n=1 Tax=Marinospirillum celere TaxID=1122252 RepID=A0A1I1IWL5_9GAMM|nr:DUF3015 family protein [Marinospirillum celere]SFC38728.1 Protein of unknown function [Marinospirillum celere]